MWSYARVEMGISKREFLSLTLRQWVELRKRRTEQDTLFEVMMARLTAMVANTGFRGWPEPRKIEEFMPSEQVKLMRQQSSRSGKIRLTKAKKRQREDSFRVIFASFKAMAQAQKKPV